MSTESAWHDFIANMHQLNQFMDIGWCVAFLNVRAVDVPFRNNSIFNSKCSNEHVQCSSCAWLRVEALRKYLFSIITMSVPLHTRMHINGNSTDRMPRLVATGCSIDISRINWKRENSNEQTELALTQQQKILEKFWMKCLWYAYKLNIRKADAQPSWFIDSIIYGAIINFCFFFY